LKHIILILLLCSINLFGQDTIKLEPSTHFSSLDYRHYGKSFAGLSEKNRVKELIVFSKDHIRVDRCYYYDNERRCLGTEYEINSDSTILVNNASWNCLSHERKTYKVNRIVNNYNVKGQVNPLIPFTKFGTFYGITAQRDTLWTEKYDHDKLKEFNLIEKKVKGKIYEVGKLSKIPLINGIDTIPDLTIDRVDLLWCCNDNRRIAYLTFTVTSIGDIVNIKSQGTSPEEEKQIALILSKHKNISAGIRKGKAVNSNYMLNVKLEYPD
jgi:hypothetical protein